MLHIITRITNTGKNERRGKSVVNFLLIREAGNRFSVVNPVTDSHEEDKQVDPKQNALRGRFSVRIG